ncbi:biotin/lipoyl-containing protein [Pseudodesulfovibrio sediminis]|uniref:Lipoyl-binding domain-containing protein n=1 Tax=Pseudodesulfovibrio sediminis TaxID=2810563 RepID=A0ABN6EVG2_9BACT|nr:biotin/lipoyl-containing protein [Pseudodesulfovibrio sediminis]BCS89200.1 hypothetical protein PSDVSF_24420 [Pseudodesulfovibrio sediminis]
MAHKVLIPRLNPNEDEVLVVETLVDGDRVEVGDELFVVESTKAAMSVESDFAGFVRGLAIETGEYAHVGSIALFITATPDESYLDEDSPTQTPSDEPKKSTAKSRLLAKKRSRSTRGKKQKVGAVTDVALAADLDWVRSAKGELGELALAEEYRDYTEDTRWDNAGCCSIGEGVTFGAGSMVRAKRLVIKDGVSIGPNTFIEGDDIFLGEFVKVGKNTSMVSVDIILGAGAYVGHEVEVDLSGGRSGESRFWGGPASLISPRCYVNTAREVVLETESALSPGVSVFTHRFWQSVLDGYDALFAGVRLCEKSWVGSGCQVLPGVVVGHGAVVMSGSTVVDQIPPATLCGGVPATVIRKSVKRDLSQEDKVQVLESILDEFSTVLKFKGCEVGMLITGKGIAVTTPDTVERQIVICTDSSLEGILPGSIVLSLNGFLPEMTEVYIFDLVGGVVRGDEDRLVHEVRNFLRRKGIRFQPYAWDADYRRGL